MGLVDMPFEIATSRRESGSRRATPTGWFRSVSTFRMHSRPVDGRRRRGGDQPRSEGDAAALIGSPRILNLDSVKDLWNYGEPYEQLSDRHCPVEEVVEYVAEKGNWGRSVPKGHGLGIAVHRSLSAYIATIVEFRSATRVR